MQVSLLGYGCFASKPFVVKPSRSSMMRGPTEQNGAQAALAPSAQVNADQDTAASTTHYKASAAVNNAVDAEHHADAALELVSVSQSLANRQEVLIVRSGFCFESGSPSWLPITYVLTPSLDHGNLGLLMFR
jgi:hypothetical protein